MKNIYQFAVLGVLAGLLSACQSGAVQYNGATGLQIDSQTATTATLTYTIANRKNQQIDQKRLQSACQQVLGKTKQYQIEVLDVREVDNPTPSNANMQTVPVLGTQVGFSNTPNLYNSEAYATQTALDARPSTLNVVQFRCA